MDCQLETLDTRTLLGESKNLEPTTSTAEFPRRPMSSAKINKHNPRTIAKCRAYRVEQKVMRDELRRQEMELRQQLLSLQREIKAKNASPKCAGFVRWRDLATRLRAERTDAEIQHQQLRFQVNNQVMYIASLREVLSGRFSDPMVFPSNMEPAAPFDNCIQELEARFLQMDEVFRVYYQHEAGDGFKYFYPRSGLVLPSSLSETSITMWQLGEQQFHDKQGYRRYDVEDPKTTFLAIFINKNVLETGEAVQIYQWCTVRRFVQGNHIVSTWKFIFEGDGIFSGIKASGTGWCRFLPSPNAMEPGTVVEICVHRVSVHTRASAPHESIVTTFHNLLQKNSQETLTNLVANLENVLLEKALTHIS